MVAFLTKDLEYFELQSINLIIMAYNNNKNRNNNHKAGKNPNFRNKSHSTNFKPKFNPRFKPFKKETAVEIQVKLNRQNPDTAIQQAMVMDGSDKSIIVAVKRQMMNRLIQTKSDMAASKFKTLTIFAIARPHLAGMAAEWLREFENSQIEKENTINGERRSNSTTLTIQEFIHQFDTRFLPKNNDMVIQANLNKLTHTGTYDQFRNAFFKLYDSMIETKDPSIDSNALEVFKSKVRPIFLSELAAINSISELRYFRPSEGLLAGDEALQKAINYTNSSGHQSQPTKFNNSNNQKWDDKKVCLRHGPCNHTTNECSVIANFIDADKKKSSKQFNKSESKN